jgi:DedD protein
MRGVFDDEEIEPARKSRDTELTLGTGAMLAIGCGLVLLCGVFFAIGFGVGHSSSAKPPSVRTPQSATEQEPLQASGGIPKPSATLQVPVAPPEDSGDAANAAGTMAASSVPTTVSAPTSGSPGIAQAEVHPALTPTGSVSQGAGNSSEPVVRPAFPSAQVPPLPQGQQFMVQIAAVSNAQDAEVLVNALKKRDYPVIAKREPADNFVHVRIGPFATRPIADQWRMKLLNDGYNAQVQP